MNDDIKLSDLPENWWQHLSACETLATWFGRHLVGLYFSVKTEGKQRQGVYTGFVLFYEENLLWITAGHVIDEINELLSNSKVNIETMHWLDGVEISGAESIPVHHRSLDTFSGTKHGIDFGAIRITGLDAQNLLNNNRTQVITEVIWKNIYLAKPEGYYILGYPLEWTKQTFESFQARIACLPVRQIEYRKNNGDKEFWNDPEAFYGQTIPFTEGSEFQPSSVKGMSGGPLFSIERDPSNKILYRLYGIQRSEDKDEHLIRVEPIHKILGLTKEEM